MQPTAYEAATSSKGHLNFSPKDKRSWLACSFAKCCFGWKGRRGHLARDT
ncbi:uncharacterized protein LACBIDRAFT_307784 [Laccaria bicolor S238N-H82]|uniref:Predicted protein n=1 Tax=Laccaria bicolor (strain S238N-H82 / ATCC MYA-4686) TaxID=486041 RepID=B0DR14_LACBS|nr:uncharacterized protein LACBIDRAFT_307784 [Laccaria bicolor S238N-H82]EDR02983.1 predicted protein [Laccaria bicolor S238N-H82]|eukprot:XP_001886406.1 predicted protein [Laccaria bicolor S238N-H82]